ncbi:MAG: hypothetical protein ETSY1_23650 [Candidatus Entotheonella factor]|uniref:Uncharacterized protein n=2 Tax=Candidatus Entotheonella TaxID=93171 RepID=W4LGR0_ENTF1|nr:MAG: hypothetical protein ETSY1_23650 [Candidatus Entotheonella factor]
MNFGHLGWDALTDLLSNLLGILIFASLLAFFFQLLSQPKGDLAGEVQTNLPVVHFIVTEAGVFPVPAQKSFKHFVKTPQVLTKERLSLVGQTDIRSGWGSVSLEFRASMARSDYCLLMEPRGQGCTATELLENTCPRFSLRDYPQGSNLFFFHVYPGGFDTFGSLCPELALLGYDTSWKPRPTSERSFQCRGNRFWILLQGISGGRAISSQSCLWLLEQQ